VWFSQLKLSSEKSLIIWELARAEVADPCRVLRLMILTEHALHSIVPRCSFLRELASVQRGLSAQLYPKTAATSSRSMKSYICRCCCASKPVKLIVPELSMHAVKHS